MKRLLNTIFATSFALGLAACESEAPKNDKTAKADKKDDEAPAKAADGEEKPAEEDAEDPGDAPAEDAAPSDDAPSDDTPSDDAAAGDDELDGYDPRVSKAARIAEQINEDPEKADEMLAAADLDRDKLDALMYEIANDPNLTAQYRIARGI